jgi:lipopolysaccharide transport protein LptA
MKVKGAIVLLCCYLCHILPFHCNASNATQKTQQIFIESDEVEYLKDQEFVLFRGNVVAVREEMTVKAPLMKAQIAQIGDGTQGITTIWCYGNTSITTKSEQATGHNGEYDVQNGVFKLIGDVILTQGDNVLSGHELVHMQKTGQSLLKNGPTSSRVKAHLTHQDDDKRKK